MIRRILILVRKDFRFNWKVAAGVLAFVAACFAYMWVEYEITHVWEDAENGGFLTCWAVAGFGIIPVNYSFRREQGASTKLFLSSLPVKTCELFIAGIATTTLYTISLAAIVLLEFWVFDIPYGMKYVMIGIPVGIFCSAVYTFLHYMFSFNIAQIFFLGSMAATVILVKWMGLDIEAMGFFSEPRITVTGCMALAVLAACIIGMLCKKKKSIL